MAGHSKWSNIKRQKGKNDAQRAKVFTKTAREISVAVRHGGPNPEENATLRDAISKARSLNVPNDNIERAIKSASEVGGDDYHEVLYEGYGPSGIAVIVKTLTDNRNRTAGSLRHYFDKHGGNLGQNGSVTYLFDQQGIIVIENKGYSEETMMEDALDAGADDFEYHEEAIEIFTAPRELGAVRDGLEEKGYTFASAELGYLPSTETVLEGDALDQMRKLIDAIEDDDDVQEVWHSWDDGDEE